MVVIGTKKICKNATVVNYFTISMVMLVFIFWTLKLSSINLEFLVTITFQS